MRACEGKGRTNQPSFAVWGPAMQQAAHTPAAEKEQNALARAPYMPLEAVAKASQPGASSCKGPTGSSRARAAAGTHGAVDNQDTGAAVPALEARIIPTARGSRSHQRSA
jgi:hypothetical protein